MCVLPSILYFLHCVLQHYKQLTIFACLQQLSRETGSLEQCCVFFSVCLKAIESEAIQIVAGSLKSHVVVKMLKDDASKLEQKQFLDEVHAYR